MVQWFIWAIGALFYLDAVYLLTNLLLGRKTNWVIHREEICHGSRGAKTNLILVTLVWGVALYLTLTNQLSTWHLAWLFPVTGFVSQEVASFVTTVERRQPIDRAGVIGGLLLAGAAMLVTILQFAYFNSASVWIIFRVSFLPIPLVLITTVVILVGTLWMIKGVLIWEWSRPVPKPKR